MSSCAKKGSWIEGVKRKQKAKAESESGKEEKGEEEAGGGTFEKAKAVCHSPKVLDSSQL
jgi:hypothetical protein